MSPEETIKNKMSELQNTLISVIPEGSTQEQKESLALNIDEKLTTIFLDELLYNIDMKLQQQGKGAEMEGLMQDLANMLSISVKGMAQNPEESFKKIFQQVQVYVSPEEVAGFYSTSCDKIIAVLKENS